MKLDVKPHQLKLVIDSGSGFDVDKARAKGGLGLTGMADRVAAVNGKFALESAAGKGTKIMVAIPL